VRRKVILPQLLLLAVVLFGWASLSRGFVDDLRGFTVSQLSFAWRWGSAVKNYLADRPSGFWSAAKETDVALAQKLALENQRLRSQIETMQQLLNLEELVQRQLATLKALSSQELQANGEPERLFFQRRTESLKDLIRKELSCVMAKPIYRDPAFWSSAVWIDVGEEQNSALGRCVVAKNSPVVMGSALIGVIDYVGQKQSRVRLITDSSLVPAVRSVRRLNEGALKYLAKGELHGSVASQGRSCSPTLKGIGFNFDFADEEGVEDKSAPIIQEGDLLVTSGLDGVFPPDLLVGQVSSVLLQTGSMTFDIEAKPAAENLGDIQSLFVLPPRGS
jgi:rod shape-determining protein MreC